MRIRILHVKRFALVQWMTTVKEDGGTEVDIIISRHKDVYVLKEAKDTHGKNSEGFSNDNIASDFNTPQSHAINDGCNVISNSVMGQVEYTMVVRVEGSKNWLSIEDLQWVSRVCCLLCVGRWVFIFLTRIRHFSHKGWVLYILVY